MVRIKQDFGRKKVVDDRQNEAVQQEIAEEQGQMPDMDYNQNVMMIGIEEDPSVNIMGGPRLMLIEEMEEQTMSSSNIPMMQQNDMDESLPCTSRQSAESSRKRKNVESDEDGLEVQGSSVKKRKEVDCSSKKKLNEVYGSSIKNLNEVYGSSIKNPNLLFIETESITNSQENESKSLHSNQIETESITYSQENESHTDFDDDNDFIMIVNGERISINIDVNDQQNQKNKRKNEAILNRVTKHRKKLPKYHWAKHPEKAEFYQLSDFKYECNHCHAVHFIEEYNNKNKKDGYLGCCNYGIMANLDQTIDHYPEDLKVLYEPENDMHKAYVGNIRKINSAFSFASLSCFNFHFATPGPPIYKIQGQMYHKFNKVAQPEDDVIPTNGQLYFLDPSEIYEQRMNVFDNCHRLMAVIEVCIRDNNTFAESYTMMKDVYEREEQKARANGVDMPEVKLLFCLKEEFDQRRYNIPVANDVYAIIVCNADDEVIPAKYVVSLKGKKDLVNLHPLDPIVEPMTYPLFYPLGTRGWNHKLKNRKFKKITLCDYVKYRLYYRDEETTGKFFPHHHSKKLFQQWCVDQYTRIEWERLMFFKTEKFQRTFAKTNYQNILDFMTKKGGEEIEKKMVILPSSYNGSPRNMVEHYMDAMTIMSSVGFPDLFITFTCNPNDPDILKTLKPGETPNDRPDMIARVFKLKKDQLIKEIVDEGIFGRAVGNVMCIEYQKRGLPHVHLIVTLGHEDKLRNKKQIDEFISAEIPDEAEDPVIYKIVTENMMHGPCNEQSICWHRKKKICIKKFPFEFCEETSLDQEGYATLRRRNNGKFVYKKGVPLSNQHVVAYNKYLLKRFQAHINVVKVANIKAVKYLYKYIYKGLDGATVECCTYDKDGQKKILKYDEVSNYLDARCLSPAEACWRIFKFPLQAKSHSVQGLPVHLEGEKIVYFDPEADEEEIKMKMEKPSTLEAYFNFFKTHPNHEFPEKNGDKYLYSEMPKYCTWDSTNGVWKYPRKNHFKSLGRLYPVNITETEKYYLYYLLLNVPGISFEYLYWFEGIRYDTYAQACLARGLCKDDAEWSNCLKEASVVRMPKALRTLFVNILMHCSPKYPERLWNDFKDDLSEDIKKKFPELPKTRIHQRALYLIDQDLKSQQKSLKDFKTMPQEIDNSDENDMADDDFYDPNEEMQVAQNFIGMMNDGQKEVMNELMTDIENGTQKCIYIDGPGGTGKTFVLKTIYHFSRAFRKKVDNMAFSGVAAIVLIKGRTLHSLFKLPLDITAQSYSALENKGKEADFIRSTDIFIWDEAPMSSRHIMNIIDKKLKELMKNNKPFGGKTFILSGDVRQVLPIKRNAARTEIVDLLIKNSSLWPNFKTLNLTQNMRADPDEIEFAHQLIEIGDGKSADEGYITIPDSCICETDLVDEIFGDIIKNKNYSELANRAILATLNTNVNDYNHRVLEAFPGEYLEPYFSIDETNPDTKFPVSLDILNAHHSSSLPDHALRLKKDCILMLMRNLNLKQGLSNGTRLQLINPMKNILQCIIITGHRKGETAFIPRITLIEDKRLPYILKRHQFPVKLAFAFSINKSQSQTFTKVGIDFQNEVFAHGQCYVALSRAKSWKGIKVVLDPENKERKIRNIVWREVLGD